jgi:hypothetical protein
VAAFLLNIAHLGGSCRTRPQPPDLQTDGGWEKRYCLWTSAADAVLASAFEATRRAALSAHRPRGDARSSRPAVQPGKPCSITTCRLNCSSLGTGCTRPCRPSVAFASQGFPQSRPSSNDDSPEHFSSVGYARISGLLPLNAAGSGSAVVPLRGAQENSFWHAKPAKSAPKTRFLGCLSPV